MRRIDMGLRGALVVLVAPVLFSCSSDTLVPTTVTVREGAATPATVTYPFQSSPGEGSIPRASTSNSSASTKPPTAADKSFRLRETLSLQEGVSDSVTFEFEAPIPIENAFDIGIKMPVGTELDLEFETSNGMTLMIFDPGKKADFCVEDDGELICRLSYPALEAPTSGTWVATVSKLSRPRAEVTITIEWTPID
jgi:hypothetical protein